MALNFWLFLGGFKDTGSSSYQGHSLLHSSIGLGLRTSGPHYRLWVGPELLTQSSMGVSSQGNTRLPVQGIGLGFGLRTNYALYLSRHFGGFLSLGLGYFLHYSERVGESLRGSNFVRAITVPQISVDANFGLAFRFALEGNHQAKKAAKPKE
ncbi:MAG: hypothetical protein AAF975_01305 [Spirochaetota bacterium]